MGADIHMVLERKMPNGEWLGLHAFPCLHIWNGRPGDHMAVGLPLATVRYYERFAKIAGVRGCGPAPRGMPDDASALAQYLVSDWDPDGHSHTWLSIGEACDLWHATEHAEDVYTSDYVKRYAREYYFGIDEETGGSTDSHRLVIWFDN